MASPVLHVAAGARLARPRWPPGRRAPLGLAAVACLPDLDFVPGLLRGDFARYHHGPSHSLVAAVLVAALTPLLGIRARGRRSLAAVAVGLAYASHLALDLVTYDGFDRDGIGLALFWPVSSARVLAPVHLFFFGVAPDARTLLDGVTRASNAWAVLWELGLFGLVTSILALGPGWLLPARKSDRTTARHPFRRTRAAFASGGMAALLLVSLPHLSGNILEELPGSGTGGSDRTPTDLDAPARELAGPESSALDSTLSNEPISPAAVSWIREHRRLIRDVADSLRVSPVSLAGIVAAEGTLLRDPFDAAVDGLFRAYFATLSESELKSWVSMQEAAYQRALRAGGDPGLRRLKNPYLWSVGPAQVSFRNALFYEPRLARLQSRATRSLGEVVATILEPRGSLEYAGVILLDAQEAYLRYAGLDLRTEPGVLATLYHLGSPARRALRLGEENRRRELVGEPPAVPRMNFYGEFVARHAGEIAGLLR